MEGAAAIGDFPFRAKLALEAGCDMVLVCSNPTAADEVLESIPISHSNVRERRLQVMRGKPQYTRAQLMQQDKWQQISHSIGQHHVA
jgi:beta-N-acetylhexosaminidase